MYLLYYITLTRMALTLRTFIVLFQCLNYFSPVSSVHSFISHSELVFLLQILYKMWMCFWKAQIPNCLVNLICNARCQRNQQRQIRVAQLNVTCMSHRQLHRAASIGVRAEEKYNHLMRKRWRERCCLVTAF